MNNELNANVLAQIAREQIEDNEVMNILKGMYEDMPCEEPERLDFDRLSAANCLSKANKSLMERFKKAVYELMRGPKGNEPRTMVIGTRMFKMYYSTSYTWENCRIPEKPEEEKTDRDRQIEVELEVFAALDAQFAEVETLLNILKQKKKASEETLAALMPNSKCIHRTPVIQVV